MDTLRRQADRRLAALKQERSSWEAHWRELSDWIQPRRGRLKGSNQDANRGEKINRNIVDSTATEALRTLRAGITMGKTPRGRPWFRLGTPDPGLQQFGPVAEWLEVVSDRMRDVFSRSNFYAALPSVYEDKGLFGTGALHVSRDPTRVCLYRPLSCGEYLAANGADDRVDTLYREFRLTVGQVVDQFGLDACGSSTRQSYQRGEYDSWVSLVHAVEPRRLRDLSRRDAKNKPWRSIYYEQGADDGRVLSEAGFDALPVAVSRWDLQGGDVYGRSPAMDALGDTRQLQKQTRVKQKAIEKHVDPPLWAPGSMRGAAADLTAGGVTYADLALGQPAFAPVYQVAPSIVGLVDDMGETRRRIRAMFYADLFAAILLSQDQRKTATEVAAMQEEKLLLLGPVLERINGELLSPVIDLTFSAMVEAGMVPAAPPDLQGMPLKVEYVSLLDQAQELVGLGGIDRLTQYVVGIAPALPGVLDKFDADQAVDEYARMLGVPSKVVRPDEDVERRRKAQAQAQEQAASMQAALELAKIAGRSPAPQGYATPVQEGVPPPMTQAEQGGLLAGAL